MKQCIKSKQKSFFQVRTTQKYCQSKHKPDTIFCMSDEILIGVMKTAQELNLKIPDEISVIAISNGFFPKLFSPEITYVETNGFKLGKLAFGRMLSYLSGVIKERQNGEMILAVGSESTGWVGYQVRTPDHVRYEALIPGERAELYVYSHIREDAFDLYGFISAAEKNLFTTLLSVSGVGPKLGLGLLSHTEAPTLIEMILSEDKAALTNISGVGKKTAERMVLEMKDLIQKKQEQGLFGKINSNISSILSFSQNTYPCTNTIFNYNILSNITPNSTPVNSIIVRCNIINNNCSIPSDILDSFLINVSFGSNII